MAVAKSSLVIAQAARRTMMLISRRMGAGFGLQAGLLSARDLQGNLVVWVPLASITRWADMEAWPRHLRNRFLLHGDWDKYLVGDLELYYEKSRSYRSTLQIFRDDVPYRECDQYRFLLDTIRKAGYHHDLEGLGKTEDELDEYFEKLAGLYDGIASGGYRSQEQLGLEGVNEIAVVLDRNGAPIRVMGGNHRFAIAQVLEVESVPVYVVGVHEQWARRLFQEAPRRDLPLALRRGLLSLSVRAGQGSDATAAPLAGTR